MRHIFIWRPLLTQHARKDFMRALFDSKAINQTINQPKPIPEANKYHCDLLLYQSYVSYYLFHHVQAYNPHRSPLRHLNISLCRSYRPNNSDDNPTFRKECQFRQDRQRCHRRGSISDCHTICSACGRCSR